jgi:hypothetical protein
MKVGDLVRFTGGSWFNPWELCSQHIGVIIDMVQLDNRDHKSFYIWWPALNKRGWWDDYRLEVVNEDR